MQGIYLKFYVAENQKHHSRVIYQWLLERARDLGIHGGSAFRAMAGFGRHGALHEDHFFELAGTLPVEVGFVVTEAQAQTLFSLIEAEGLSLFYVKQPIEYGVTGSRTE
jgi:PII-like signaling protein